MNIQKEKKLLIIFGLINIIIISTALLANAQNYTETEINAQIAVASEINMVTKEKNMDFITWLREDVPAELINVNIYFNSEYLTVQIYQENKNGGVIIIYDEDGEVSKKVLVAPNHQTLQINVKNLRVGSYKLVFQNTTNYLTKEFIKR